MIDWDARDKALDKALRLHGAYAQKNPKLAAPAGVKVITMYAPRPIPENYIEDVKPGPLPGSLIKKFGKSY